jgi:hypothetical protein
MAQKYKNITVTFGDKGFDSLKESRRWNELNLLQRAGKITDLQRQVKFVLIPTQYEKYERYSNKTGNRLKDGIRAVEKECAYYDDFVYFKDGEMVVEDVKSKATKTKDYIIKRKLMLSVHNIKIKEV